MYFSGPVGAKGKRAGTFGVHAGPGPQNRAGRDMRRTPSDVEMDEWLRTGATTVTRAQGP